MTAASTKQEHMVDHCQTQLFKLAMTTSLQSQAISRPHAVAYKLQLLPRPPDLWLFRSCLSTLFARQRMAVPTNLPWIKAAVAVLCTPYCGVATGSFACGPRQLFGIFGRLKICYYRSPSEQLTPICLQCTNLFGQSPRSLPFLQQWPSLGQVKAKAIKRNKSKIQNTFPIPPKKYSNPPYFSNDDFESVGVALGKPRDARAITARYFAEGIAGNLPSGPSSFQRIQNLSDLNELGMEGFAV